MKLIINTRWRWEITKISLKQGRRRIERSLINLAWKKASQSFSLNQDLGLLADCLLNCDCNWAPKEPVRPTCTPCQPSTHLNILPLKENIQQRGKWNSQSTFVHSVCLIRVRNISHGRQVDKYFIIKSRECGLSLQYYFLFLISFRLPFWWWCWGSVGCFVLLLLYGGTKLTITL